MGIILINRNPVVFAISRLLHGIMTLDMPLGLSLVHYS